VTAPTSKTTSQPPGYTTLWGTTHSRAVFSFVTGQPTEAAERNPEPADFAERRPAFVPLLICALAALIAVQDLPYVAYEFLRVLLTSAAGFLIFRAILAEKWWWIIAGAIIGFLWAPAGWVSFPQPVWQILDVAVAITLIIAGATIPASPLNEEGKRMSWWLFALLWFGGTMMLMWGALTTGSQPSAFD
jgi:hypothetical protein